MSSEVLDRAEPCLAPAAPGPPERTRRFALLALVSLILGLALVVRAALFGFQTLDYSQFYRVWIAFITEHGGFRALRYDFSDQNLPFRYVLVFVAYLPLPPLAGLKLVSVFFEVLLAYFAYRITALRFGAGWTPLVAAIVVFLLPTVVLNGSMWGQGDAIYASFSLGALYFLLAKRPWWACVFFGLALSFKLQSIFLFPLLPILAATGRIKWRCLLAVPAVAFLMDVPALLAGAAPGKVFGVYAAQPELWPRLTMNAPSVWQFFRGQGMEVLRLPGILFAGVLVLLLCLLVLLSRVELTDSRILLLATLSAVLVPYALPSMHDRYFYLADILSVLLAFHFGRLWFVPIGVQFASLMSYLPFLAWSRPGGEPVDFRILAALELAMLAVLAREAYRQLTAADPPS